MGESKRYQEKRKHMRVVLDAYVLATLTAENGHTEKIFTTKDMSPEGVFLISKESFPAGTVVSLTIHAPTSLNPVHVQAEVARVVKDDKSQPAGMGLVFIKISESGKKELLKSLYLVYQAGDNKSSR